MNFLIKNCLIRAEDALSLHSQDSSTLPAPDGRRASANKTLVVLLVVVANKKFKINYFSHFRDSRFASSSDPFPFLLLQLYPHLQYYQINNKLTSNPLLGKCNCGQLRLPKLKCQMTKPKGRYG